MKKYSLVHIGRDTFIVLNLRDALLGSRCTSKVTILIDKLDRRTKKFKQFERDYQYFSVSFLPEIKKRELGNSLTPYKFK
ncbi:MAG TPA: hypothetical protein VIV55_10245 [Flavobacterium sp.]